MHGEPQRNRYSSLGSWRKGPWRLPDTLVTVEKSAAAATYGGAWIGKGTRCAESTKWEFEHGRLEVAIESRTDAAREDNLCNVSLGDSR